MAHVLSDAEERLRRTGPDRVRRKSALALDRLAAVAGSGGVGSATLVVALLESAADAAEKHLPTGALPTDERDLWAFVGARFDAGAQRSNDRQLVDAFAALLARSVIGDGAMAEVLGVDRSRISQRLAEQSLYGFTAADERCFPRWQVAGGKPLPGLRVVLAALDPALHPLAVDHWFTTPNVDLEIDAQPVAPATWLATAGDPAAAAASAPDR